MGVGVIDGAVETTPGDRHRQSIVLHNYWPSKGKDISIAASDYRRFQLRHFYWHIQYGVSFWGKVVADEKCNLFLLAPWNAKFNLKLVEKESVLSNIPILFHPLPF